MNLGDHFPENFREEYAERSIEIGCVIRKFVQYTIPPKEKRFVVVAFDSEKVALAAVLINTSINENVNYSDELKSLHIPISKAGRSYLSHDSFIDCTELFEESVASMKAYVTDNPECVLGILSDDDLIKAHRLITQSPAIKPFKKKRFGFQ